MQFGASTFLWVSPFGTDAFDLAYKVRDMGFDILEVAVEQQEIVDWKKLKEIVKETGLKVTISGAFGAERDISNEDPRIREQGLKYINDCVRIAADMESPVFCGPVYSAVGKTRAIPEDQKKRERDWCVENLRKAARAAAESGVTIGLEPLNRFESDMVNTAAQAVSIVTEVSDPALKIALDTFHCNIEEKNIPDAIREVGTLLCHVQGNESDRGTPGTGHLDWTGIREALEEIGYEGAMVIETFGAPSKELARAACIWRPLAGSPDELAREGLAFYKELFSEQAPS